MIGLNVTTQVCTSEERLKTMENLGNKVGEELAKILRFGVALYRDEGFPGRCIHDACIVAALLRPELFHFTPMRVSINHSNVLRYGESLVSPLNEDDQEDKSEDKDPLSLASVVEVADSVKADDVFDLILELLKAY